jgi:hypothetical protein
MDNSTLLKQSQLKSQHQIRKARTAKVIKAIEKDQRRRRSNESPSIDWESENMLLQPIDEINPYSTSHDCLQSGKSSLIHGSMNSENTIITPTLPFLEENFLLNTSKARGNDSFMEAGHKVNAKLFDGLLVCAPNREDYLEKMLDPINDDAVDKKRVKRRKAIISQEEIRLFINDL